MRPPADPDEIAAVELRLGIKLPTDLSELCEAADGTYDKPGRWFVMWRLGDVADWNLEAWYGWEAEARRTFLGFGDDGTGRPFCVALGGPPAV